MQKIFVFQVGGIQFTGQNLDAHKHTHAYRNHTHAYRNTHMHIETMHIGY